MVGQPPSVAHSSVQAGGASATAARGTLATVKVSAVSADTIATNHFTCIAVLLPVIGGVIAEWKKLFSNVQPANAWSLGS
jgi:hypothetical protein